jgi:deoxyadenosine/deoxycytidine kinase
MTYSAWKKSLLDRGVSVIAVEGNIGVGKTTLSRMLARHIGARLVEEKVEDNPFLDRFYEDMGAFRLQTQLVFLLNRYRQQISLAQKELFDDLTIIDYIFARDKIFAHVNLSDDELGLYNRIAQELEARVVKPDLVIYLQARGEVLYERILRRGRPLERTISKDYLETLNEAFNHYFFGYEETPLLVVNTDSMDFVNDERHFRDLVKRISEPVVGTEFYVPSWEAR